jgi:small subunit ribosomal protein S20
MANIASAKKDARRSAVRAVRNRGIKSAVKTKVTRFRRGAAEGAEDVAELAERAISSLDRAVSKGVLHRNNAARRKARLVKQLKAAGAEQPAAAETKTKTKTKAKPAAKAAQRKAPARKKS